MKFKIIIFFTVILLIFLVYSFPIQKLLAEKNISLYINEQGTSLENATNKRIFKDYKTGGYNIAIKYKDQSDYEYYYNYSRKNSNKKYNVFCSIYNNEGVEVGVTGETVKYPPLNDLN